MTANTEANINALNDTQLQEAVGGASEVPNARKIYDTKGRLIGYCRHNALYYWQCTHCGGPVHKNGPFWCDKCDDWWISRAAHEWTGTEAELIAAAN